MPLDHPLSSQLKLIRDQYRSMSAVQLRKQHVKLVIDLQQSYQLLEQLMRTRQSQLSEMNHQSQRLEKSWHCNHRLIHRLEKSLQNFEFMLSKEYPIRLEEEIPSLKQKLKQTKEQVSLLRRQMEIPMQKDQSICDRMLGTLHQLQGQIQEIRTRNRNKSNHLVRVNGQNREKKEAISASQRTIEKFEENIQNEGLAQQQDPEGELRLKSMAKLTRKKHILSQVLNRLERRFLMEYQHRKKSQQVLAGTEKDINSYLQDLQLHIDRTQAQINDLRELKKAKEMKQLSLPKHNMCKGKGFLHRLPTQNPLDRTWANLGPSGTRKHSEGNFITGTKAQKRQSQDTCLLPSIYQVLGKERLLVEEDCDINSLVYQGLN